MVELLVVVVIILIVLTVATPAFQALIYSSSRSQAFNTVNAAALAARELALRSASGEDGAVVFIYDASGSMRIIPAVQVGTMLEPVWGSGGPGGGGPSQIGASTVERDVFAPVPQAPAFEMPTFWNVRGYAPARSMIDFSPNAGTGSGPDRDLVAVWYNSELYGGSLVNAPQKQESNWVFPETDFYDKSRQAANAGPGRPTARQSFMIRFDARTGALSNNRAPAIFIDPRPSTNDRIGGDRPNASQLWLRPDRAENLARWAQRLIASAPIDATGNPFAPYVIGDPRDIRPQLVGLASNDTILVKPVARIAVYDERQMGRDIGARRLNSQTNSLFRPFTPAAGGDIGLDPELFNGSVPNDIRQRINAWIEGDTNFDEEFDDQDQPQARIFLVRPSTGELTEVLR
ncbi:MAG: hypothetical protein LAT64_03470 [Phycisphaerales bacterium]|nr:hypothetical protein [Planctomycetota bacterium]MCH8507811.1 hypothetical protein [Phycisphaerales bacterium]